MANYYIRRRGGELVGPFPSYAAASGNHADFLARNAIPPEYQPQMETFLELSSVSAEAGDLRRALLDDPVLAAMFALGHRRGYEQACELYR